MNTYLVIAHAALFSTTRIVEATSKAEAAAQVDQIGVKVMWIEEVTGEE